MAWKASKTQIASSLVMNGFIIGGIGLQIFVVILTIILQISFVKRRDGSRRSTETTGIAYLARYKSPC